MLVAPPGDDLVRVGLVAHVPDQAVAGRVEHVVKRHGQLDHAEPCAEMAAGHRDGVDGLGPQLFRNLLELLDGKAAEVFGAVHAIQMRRLRHGSLPVVRHPVVDEVQHSLHQKKNPDLPKFGFQVTPLNWSSGLDPARRGHRERTGVNHVKLACSRRT